MTDGGAFGDFEEAAEASAAWAYNRAVTRSGAAYLGMAALFLALVLCDWAYAVVAAFWALPVYLGLPLMIAMGVEFGFLGAAVHLGRRERKPGPAAAGGERLQETAARLQSPRRSWWRTPVRGWRFWAGLLSRAVYSSCVGAVFAAWLGAPVGVAAGLAYTAAVLALGELLGSAQVGFGKVLAFSDPAPPRDGPEV